MQILYLNIRVLGKIETYKNIVLSQLLCMDTTNLHISKINNNAEDKECIIINNNLLFQQSEKGNININSINTRVRVSAY